MKDYRTKKVALPGGEVIEIVYFSEPTGAATEPVGATVDVHDERDHEAGPDVLVTGGAGAVELHVCPSCESEMVYPVRWGQSTGDVWSIDRRCPNCEWRHTGEFSLDEVELFDDVLNDGTEDLMVSLRNAALANMEADVERLIEAIRADRIEPMDF